MLPLCYQLYHLQFHHTCVGAIFVILKVLYYEKHVFSGLYKLVHPDTSNSQNEQSK